MLTDGLYPIFKIILNIPGTAIIEKIGKRKSLLLANLCLAIYLIALIFTTNVLSLVFAYIIMAFAFTIKNIAESNLLYDSFSHKKQKSRQIYAKSEEIGARNYYYLDGISSLAIGFLFIINGYLPIIISLIFAIIAIIVTTGFKEVQSIEKEKAKSIFEKFKDYKEELQTSFKFIFKSHRLQAIMIFTLFFSGFIYASYTLRESMLSELNVAPQYFSIIIASLTIISGIFASLQKVVHNKFRNKALTFIVTIYIPTFFIVGLISLLNINFYVKLSIILAMYVIQYAMQSPYETLFSVYIKNFTEDDMRIKIASAFNLVKSISQIGIALISSCLLSLYTVANNFVIMGIAFFVIMFIILIYMKPGFGLKPEEYKSSDISAVPKLSLT